MRITQGTFSFLPDFTDDQIRAQVQWCIDNKWAVSVEHTDDPHPRNIYWDMFGLPMFDANDPAAVLFEVNECRRVFPDHYIRVNGYDRSHGSSSTKLSFIVNRPANEPGFALDRTEIQDRAQRYSIRRKQA